MKPLAVPRNLKRRPAPGHADVLRQWAERALANYDGVVAAAGAAVASAVLRSGNLAMLEELAPPEELARHMGEMARSYLRRNFGAK
jgi:hypothetical protein